MIPGLRYQTNVSSLNPLPFVKLIGGMNTSTHHPSPQGQQRRDTWLPAILGHDSLVYVYDLVH